MTFEIGLLLFLIVAALVCFSFDWLSSDVVALGLLLALILSGLLSPADAFAGFGSETVIMILGLLIMTSALIKTGVVALAGQAVLRAAGSSPDRVLAFMMVGCAALSAFISNTAAAAFFLPIVIAVAAKSKTSPSRFLMPVAFASILTSSVTLISTSTNLVISGLMTRAGLSPIGFFELTPVGLPIAAVGLAYTFFIGRHLVRSRAPSQGLLDQFGLRSYVTDVVVLPSSPWAGKTVGEFSFKGGLELTLLRIIRDKTRYLLPQRKMTLAAGDVLLVEGARTDVLKIKDTAGLELRAELELSDPDLSDEDASLVEALVVPGSRLVERTLREIRLRETYGVQVLGINRHGKNIVEKISHVPLRVGDVLLLQGRATGFAHIEREGLVSVLHAVEGEAGNRPKAWRAITIFGAALVLAGTNTLPLAVAVLLGAFAVFATRCITAADAYRDVDWRVLILIASMLGLGQAMVQTGTAEYLAEHVAHFASGLAPMWVLAGFFLLTVLLTQPMSNQAAAAVIVPIAIHTALRLGLNPRAFVMAIAVAASCSYLTPLEPACLMVYGPGRYRFWDFVRVGGPLVFVLFAMAMYLVPRLWPLQPGI